MYHVIESGFSGQFQNTTPNIIIYNIFLKFSNNDVFINDYNSNFVISYEDIEHTDLDVNIRNSPLYVNMTTLYIDTQLVFDNITNTYHLPVPFKLLNKYTKAVLTEFNFNIALVDLSGNNLTDLFNTGDDFCVVTTYDYGDPPLYFPISGPHNIIAQANFTNIDISCLDEDTLILTDNGYVKASEININDKLVGLNNKSSKVIKINKTQVISTNDLYEIEANAFGNDMPFKSFILTGEHGINIKNNQFYHPLHKTNNKIKQLTLPTYVNLYNFILDNKNALICANGLFIEQERRNTKWSCKKINNEYNCYDMTQNCDYVNYIRTKGI